MLNLDMQIVITGAFRYALGRMTYVVDSTCTVIEATVTEIETNGLALMVREIDAAIKEKSIGMDMDKDRWLKCRAVMQAEIERRAAA